MYNDYMDNLFERRQETMPMQQPAQPGLGQMQQSNQPGLTMPAMQQPSTQPMPLPQGRPPMQQPSTQPMPLPQGRPPMQQPSTQPMPLPQPIPQPQPLPNPSTEVGKIYTYDVRRGDSVYQIARRFNTSVEFIKDMNHLNENAMIHPGQKLLVPVLYKRPQPRPAMRNAPKVQVQPQNRQSYDLYF